MKLSEVVFKVNTGADAIKRAPIVEKDTGVKCLRIGDISQKKKITQWGFTKVTPDVFEKFQLKAGDIIIARTGNTIGVNFFIEQDMPSVFNNGLIRIKVDKTKILPRFFYYLMQTVQFKNHILSICFGTSTQPNMQIDDLLFYEVDIPKLETQVKVVSILKKIDDKIELNNQINETLESMAKAIFKEWFIDFGPVKAKAEGKKPFGMDDETAALFPDRFEESELGLIPSGWSINTIGESCDVLMGQSPPGITYNENRDGVVFYQGRAEFGDRFPTARLYCTAPTRQVKKGTILLSVRAPVGDLNIATEEICIGRGLAGLLHKVGGATYTYYLLSSFKGKFDMYNGEGTVFGSINKDTLANIKYASPPLDL